MRTNIRKNGDVVVVEMEGRIDFEGQAPFKMDLDGIIDSIEKETTPKQIIFDFQHLEFVGSSGITAFVQTLKDFNKRAPVRPQYHRLKSEFRKIIRAFDEDETFQIFEGTDPHFPSGYDH